MSFGSRTHPANLFGMLSKHQNNSAADFTGTRLGKVAALGQCTCHAHTEAHVEAHGDLITE